jgi:hypothetical protein
MLYATIFDFALVGVVLSALVFFVWCWFAFSEDRQRHPVYSQSATHTEQLLAREEEGRRCA